VLFAHGSGSSRHSPRNRQVAAELARAGLGTFLFDLLTRDEDLADRERRFDLALLTRRLIGATEAVRRDERTRGWRLGYFGASTGAAAALNAAAALGPTIGAVVSRGGRPDLADRIERVRAPTLLLVGAEDHGVIELNRAAYERLAGEKCLELVPNATHLFEEPGTLERVAQRAAEWFTIHLRGGCSG
jgi:putative phosphoribosyl transferase